VSSVLSHLFRLLITRVGLPLVSGDNRDAEILVLRHQIFVLKRQLERPRFTPTDRAIFAVLSRAFDRRHLGLWVPEILSWVVDLGKQPRS
jgi:hypothetical protein